MINEMNLKKIEKKLQIINTDQTCIIKINIQEISCKKELFLEIEKSFKFPSYAKGINNWDWLNDSLADLGWLMNYNSFFVVIFGYKLCKLSDIDMKYFEEIISNFDKFWNYDVITIADPKYYRLTNVFYVN